MLTELPSSTARETSRSKRFEAANRLVEVVDEEVQVHPVLHRLCFWDALQGEGGPVPSQSDVPALDDTVHDQVGRGRPEGHHPIEV
jgi:hypothetical protein